MTLRFHFTRCRYFLGHVACRNLPWQGLSYGHTVQSVAARSIVHKFLKRSPALRALRLASVSERFNSTRKLKKKPRKRKSHP